MPVRGSESAKNGSVDTSRAQYGALASSEIMSMVINTPDYRPSYRSCIVLAQNIAILNITSK